jgi:prevent-host-death family protein
MPARTSSRTTHKPARLATWLLQDAKARLSELVRLAATAGPQHITVHGREAAIVISPEEYQRLLNRQTGQALTDVMQACPDPNFDFLSERARMPVRDATM